MMNTKIIEQIKKNIIIDQLGNALYIKDKPTKIISTVPSITALLHHLGLAENVIGITKFCIEPREWYITKEKIGGTKTLHIKKIKALQPDLVIANKEENVLDQIDELKEFTTVYISDVKCLEDALQLIESIGKLTKTTTKAKAINDRISKKFDSIILPKIKKTVIYLIWQNPFMTIGKDTFIHDMLEKIGYKNLYKSNLRYPTLSLDDIKEQKPNYLFLSSEPYPFKEKQLLNLQKELPFTKVVLVDGQMFSWYGSKLLDSPSYFQNLIKEIE